jgi:hypothetical protein
MVMSGTFILRGQSGLDDEMPMGVPDLLYYSDGQGEVRDGIEPIFDSATCLDERGIVFDADVNLNYYFGR